MDDLRVPLFSETPKYQQKGSTSKKNQGASYYVQTQTRHFFYRGNGTLKFTLHLPSLIPPNYLYTSMTPENGLGQREGQNQSPQVTRCFLPVFVWILWQHWKDSMEKKRFKNSPFKNFPKAIRGRWGPSIVQRFPQNSRSGVSSTKWWGLMGPFLPPFFPNLAVVQANDIGGEICEIHLIPGEGVGWTAHLKNMLGKLDHETPIFRWGEN